MWTSLLRHLIAPASIWIFTDGKELVLAAAASGVAWGFSYLEKKLAKKKII